MSTKSRAKKNDKAHASHLASKKKIKKVVVAKKKQAIVAVKKKATAVKKKAEGITHKVVRGVQSTVKGVKNRVKDVKKTVKKAVSDTQKNLKKKISKIDKSSTKKIATGAIIGCAVGCIAANMLASKNSKGLADTAKEYTDNFKTMLADMGSNVSDTVQDKVDYVNDKAHDVINSVRKEIGEFPNLENKDFKKGLIVGAAMGGLLGSGSTMMHNWHANQKDSNTDWKAIVKNVLHLLDVGNHPDESQHIEVASNKTNDVLDFATAGIQLWKKMKK